MGLTQNQKDENDNQEQDPKTTARGLCLAAALTPRACFRLRWFASARQMFPDIVLDRYPACAFADFTGRHAITSQLFGTSWPG